ncbi:MAG: hypothetical protein HQL67_07930 [Magnetococcales bacterium]|nr:hypothetical protein [Magnetococcales bacterium]
MNIFGMVKRESDVGSQVMAAMSYLGILSLVPLIVNRRDPYVRFHSKQGLIIWIWEVLAVFALAIPIAGRLVFQVSSLLCFMLSVAGLISVLLGRAWKLPVIHKFAEKL